MVGFTRKPRGPPKPFWGGFPPKKNMAQHDRVWSLSGDAERVGKWLPTHQHGAPNKPKNRTGAVFHFCDARKKTPAASDNPFLFIPKRWDAWGLFVEGARAYPLLQIPGIFSGYHDPLRKQVWYLSWKTDRFSQKYQLKRAGI